MSPWEEIAKLKDELNNAIIGQSKLIDRILIALLADGHLLVEGAPGLAKTRAIKTLAAGIDCDFHRIQFTPDLLPADITGTEIYRPQDGTFVFQPGPIFHNLILADEINRAPAKVQSALLEAMGEHQVSVGPTTHPLPELFLVMATQNSLEQEGTYPLPEAQLDRFLLHVLLDYPTIEAERQILQLTRQEASQANNHSPQLSTNIQQAVLFSARQQVLDIHMAPEVEEYIVQLVMASRQPKAYSDELDSWIEYGVSPRGTIAMDRCTRCLAWLQGRDFVTPSDVQAICHDTLRHRIGLSFEAEANGMSADQVIDALLKAVPAP